MKLISLGNSCKVRESIDRENCEGQATLIFDWVISNFESVVKIMEHISKKDENTIFASSSFKNEGIHINNQTHHCASHNEILFQSIHDMPSQISFESQIEDLVEKYRRRSRRFRTIVETETEPIHFIYFISFYQNIPNVDQMYYFLTHIETMRGNKNFFIHLLVPPEFHSFRKELYENVITNQVKLVFMNKDKNIDPFKEQRRDLNWETFYEFIS